MIRSLGYAGCSLIALSLVLAGCDGAGPGPDPPPPPEPVTVLEGQVVGDETGDPIEGATITTIPATVTASTDAEGRFVIDNIEAGEYTVIAQTSGYESNSVTVAVESGETRQVTLRLTEETGEVINEQGPIMPLDIGNTWVFDYQDEPYKLEMTETREIGGETYYQLLINYGADDRVTNQYVTDSTASGARVGTIILATGANETTFLEYPVEGATYTYTEPNGETHTYTVQKEEITVPTGTFAVVTYSGYADDPSVTFSLAPGIGPVRLTYADGSEAVLVDCQTETYACQ